MLFLDLAEIPDLVGTNRLISSSTRSACSFLPTDHLSGQNSLDDEVRTVVEQETSIRPEGRIRLLTQLRYFGYYFSPLNLFYVYSKDDSSVESIVAEVNNTPWGERHCYVLSKGNQTDANSLKFQHSKALHVSPFMPMDQQYRWRLQQPTDRLSVSLENIQNHERLFAASLNLQRRELSRTQLRKMSLRYPLMTLQIIAAIHLQALRLWWKKCPVYHHPKIATSPIQPNHKS